MCIPLPLPVAVATLADWVTSDERVDTGVAHRARVRVHPGHGGLLTWLRAQNASQKVLSVNRPATL